MLDWSMAMAILAVFLLYALIDSIGSIWYNAAATIILGINNVLFAVYAYKISCIIRVETKTAPRNTLLYAHFVNMSLFTVGGGVMVYFMIQ